MTECIRTKMKNGDEYQWLMHCRNARTSTNKTIQASI